MHTTVGILADVPPSNDELTQAHSPRGFALLSMRSPSVNRLYPQVPNGTGFWSPTGTRTSGTWL
jgi:p-hydroxybenzoate 3-monooxygenase